MKVHLRRGSYAPERYGFSLLELKTSPSDLGPSAYHILSETKFGDTRVFNLKAFVHSYRCLAAVQYWQSLWPTASGRYENGESGVCQSHDGRAWVAQELRALHHCLSPAPSQRSKRLCPFPHRCSILLNLSFSLLPGEALPKPVIPQNAHSMQNTRSVVLSCLAVVVLSLYKSPAKKKKKKVFPAWTVQCPVLCSETA